MTITGVQVTYEVGGIDYVATADVDLAACPPGTTTAEDGERPCRTRRRHR